MRSESEDMRAILDAALAKHQSGALVQARALYTRILERHPEHADALHFLGLIAHETGQQAAAAELIRKAIANNPSVASYHNNPRLLVS
jgi:Tfp pilus assembly protein PilF